MNVTYVDNLEQLLAWLPKGPPDRAMLRAMLTQLHEQDDQGALMGLADFLREEGLTLGEVCRLYAGPVADATYLPLTAIRLFAQGEPGADPRALAEAFKTVLLSWIAAPTTVRQEGHVLDLKRRILALFPQAQALWPCGLCADGKIIPEGAFAYVVADKTFCQCQACQGRGGKVLCAPEMVPAFGSFPAISYQLES